jgi:hypothetical protein
MKNTDVAFRPQGDRESSGSEGRIVNSWRVDPERDHPRANEANLESCGCGCFAAWTSSGA